MKKIRKKIDWYVWGEWPGIPWFHCCYLFGLGLELKNRCGIKLKHLAADYDGTTQTGYLSRKEWSEAGKKYLELILKNPSILKRHLAIVEMAAKKLLRINNRLLSTNFSAQDKSTLIKLYKVYHSAKHELWSSGMVGNLLELNQAYLSEYLQKYVRIHAGRVIHKDEWQALITPLELSNIQKEELDFLQIAMGIEKNTKLTNILGQTPSPNKLEAKLKEYPKIYGLLRQHYYKYRWIQYGWVGPALEFEFYTARLRGILREKNAAKNSAELKREYKKLARTQKKLEHEIYFDKKHKHLLILLRRLLFGKTLRVDTLFHAYYSIEPLLKEITTRKRVSIKLVYAMHGDNLVKFVDGDKTLLAQAKKAVKYSAYIKEGNKLKLYVGQTAKGKMANVLASLPKINKTHELSGQVAFIGKVIGRVKILYFAKDIPKLRKGDVLVSPATDPSLLPAMKKAAAFVTDMGGLTAHAAIVAREMKKPCIVGTQSATKVFKDGDLVEVDANKGVVKKI